MLETERRLKELCEKQFDSTAESFQHIAVDDLQRAETMTIKMV